MNKLYVELKISWFEFCYIWAGIIVPEVTIASIVTQICVLASDILRNFAHLNITIICSMWPSTVNGPA